MEVGAKNLDKFLQYLQKTSQKVETETGKALAKCCAVIQREAMESMTNTEIDVGKSYYTHNKKIAHHPSVERNPPAVDTGTLRRSITYTIDEKNKVGKVGSVLNNPPYGAYLESGTSRMPIPRPWLKPALDNSEEDIKKILRSVLND